MASVSSLHAQECARCGSKLIVPEWDERVNAREVQYLWRCLNCRNTSLSPSSLPKESHFPSQKSPNHSLQV